MAEINVRSDAVDVEQIMRQIRTRIREKRGTDYTEAELQELARVKLETFLDPRGVRSDLIQQFRAQRPVAPAPPNFEFGEETLFETHRGPLRALRRLLKPILKLFFNPDRITSALHLQAAINTQAEQRLRRLEEREPLYYELVHNLTLEVTRLGIEVHNMKMRVESLSSRLDFDERRARALETVVQYRPQPRQGQSALAQPSASAQAPGASQAGAATPAGPGDAQPGAAGEPRRRRRRRRRRRPGQTMADGAAQHPAAGGADLADEPGDDGADETDAYESADESESSGPGDSDPSDQ